MSTLPELFARQAARTPDAVAVVSAAGTLTYTQLRRRVTDLASSLQTRGIGRGDIVAVRMERSADLVATLLGVLESGAAYLPVDLGTPDSRVDLIFAEARPACVLTAYETTLPARSGVRGPSPVAGDTAYVIYTSGSTGRPKGVVVPHRAIAHHMRWMQQAYPLGIGDRVLVKTHVGFDVSTYEYFWPLLAGATAVVAEPGGEREPQYLADVIEEQQVTTVQFVPSMLGMFLDHDITARCRSLRRVICIGEALPVPLRNRFHRLLDAELHNLYGPTEATVAATAWHCVPGRDPDTVPIGHPVPATGIHVLDAALGEVPPGATGEIYLSGVQLADGYLGRPALTAERFVASPAGAPGSRLYRTGDLGRRRKDSAVEYVGRTDSQVKFRGQRIELGEIEAVLCTHPAVSQAAVVLGEGTDDSGRLIGYVTGMARGSDPGPAPNHEELTEHLRARLPAYMVPGTWVHLPRFPLTDNGKLDRKRLPAPAPSSAPGPVSAEAAAAGGSPVAGSTSPVRGVAGMLCAMTADVLGLTDGGATPGHTFVGLGGDSISAIRLVSQARQAGVVLTIAQVTGSDTLAGLAAAATLTDTPPDLSVPGDGPGTPPPAAVHAPGSLLELSPEEHYAIEAELHHS